MFLVLCYYANNGLTVNLLGKRLFDNNRSANCKVIDHPYPNNFPVKASSKKSPRGGTKTSWSPRRSLLLNNLPFNQ